MSNDEDGARSGVPGLAGRLRALRAATRPHISQTVAAAAIGATQNKISRIEVGRYRPSPEEVATLVRLYGVRASEARELVEWARALRPATVDARTIFRRASGQADLQDRIGVAERASREIRSYQPVMVVGALQTAAYASVVFGGDERSVIARIRRAREVLAEPRRRWTIVQTEGALLWNLGGAAVMAEQLRAMVDASRLPNVDLRIISHREAVDLPGIGAFHLFDDHTVHIGTLTATSLTSHAQDIADYRARFDLLAQRAVGGSAARAVIQHIAETYLADRQQGST